MSSSLPPILLACAAMAGIAGRFWPGRRPAEAVSLSACFLALAGLVRAWIAAPAPAATPGLLFGLATAGLWLAATVAATGYLQDRARTRYHVFSTLSLAGALGVYAAGDFLTLFIFFELAALSSYVLVVHEQTGEAQVAGKLYLYLGFAGGLSILAGTMLLAALTDGTGFAPGSLSGTGGLLIVALLGLGFWIKAGVVPFHFWLPRAHPVAPAPASALLSGVIIKTGLYGLYRSLSLLAPGPASQAAGQLLLAAGLASMLLGGLLALLEAEPKRLLAYSSISQMGYLAVALGVAGLPGAPAGTLAGMGLYLFSHAFCKGALFMLTGMIALKAKAAGRTSLAGAGRGMPFMALAALIAAGGLAGVPGLSGYPGKTLIQGALPEGLLSLAGLGLVPLVFRLGGLLTVAYLARFLYLLFMAGPPLPQRRETALGRGLAAAMGLLLLSVGLYPNAWLSGLVLPAMVGPAGLEITVFGRYAFKSLQWPLLPGLTLFLLAGRRNYACPRWLAGWSGERVVAALVRLGLAVCRQAAGLDRWIDRGYHGLPRVAARVAAWSTLLDCSLDGGYHRLARLGGKMVECAAQTDYSLDEGYHGLAGLGGKMVECAAQTDWTADQGRQGALPLANLNVASLLLVGVIVVWLLILVVGRGSCAGVPPGL